MSSRRVAKVSLARTPRTVVAAVSRPYLGGSPMASVAPVAPPPAAYEPTGEGVRVERLKTLAALRDSGALTEAEFQEEKRRILDGLQHARGTVQCPRATHCW